MLYNLQGVESGRVKSKGCRKLAFPIYTIGKPILSDSVWIPKNQVEGIHSNNVKSIREGSLTSIFLDF